jgi:hypothetical protein
VGDVAKAVAALEEEVAEARELRQIVERVDTEIAARLEELHGIGGAILELHSDLDNQIAEHDYSAVEQSVGTLESLVDTARLLPEIDAVLLLTALRDDTPIPDLTVPLELFKADENPACAHPRLTQDDLDQQFKSEMAVADQRWESVSGDQDSSSPAEREGRRAEYLGSAEEDAVRNRARRAGLHLMELVDYIWDELWPPLISAVEGGSREDATRTLAAIVAATREARSAYELYEANLAIQYEKNPSSLGAMGEFLTGVEGWLRSQGDA